MSEFEFATASTCGARSSPNTAPLPLGPKVVMTLAALVERAGEVVSKEELLERAGLEISTRRATHAKRLRAQGAEPRLKRAPDRSHGAATGSWRRFGLRSGARCTDARCGVREPANGAVRTSATASLRSAVQRPAVLAFVACLIALSVVGATGSSRVAPLSPAGAQRYALGRYYWNAHAFVLAAQPALLRERRAQRPAQSAWIRRRRRRIHAAPAVRRSVAALERRAREGVDERAAGTCARPLLARRRDARHLIRSRGLTRGEH